MAEESRYLTHPEAAARARMSPTLLYQHNANGTGPRRIKVGGRVLYRPEDIDEWLGRACRARSVLRRRSGPGDRAASTLFNQRVRRSK